MDDILFYPPPFGVDVKKKATLGTVVEKLESKVFGSFGKHRGSF